MVLAGAESTCEKYSAFLNWFYPKVKQFKWKHKRITDKTTETKCLSYLIKHV